MPQQTDSLSLIDMVRSQGIASINPSSLPHCPEYGFLPSGRPLGRSGLISIIDQAIRMIDDDLADDELGDNRQPSANQSSPSSRRDPPLYPQQ